MIQSIKIANFGPIKDPVELSFEAVENNEQDAYEVLMPDGVKLLKLAYIYGANASGKTSILKAFEFLRKLLLKPLNDKASELDYDPFLFQRHPEHQTSSIELAFYFDKIRYVYEVIFDKQSVVTEKIVYYLSAKPTEFFSRTTDAVKRLAKIEFGNKVKVPSREKDLLESNTLHNNSVIGAFAKTNVDIPELERLNKWFNKFLLGTIFSDYDLTEVTAVQVDQNPLINIWVNEFLNKADRQISSVTIPTVNGQMSLQLDNVQVDFTDRLLPDPSERFRSNTKTAKYWGGGPGRRKIDFVHSINNQNYTLSILKESNGTKRYFGLGGPMYRLIHESCILCIDELETSLHPDLMKHLLQTFLINAKSSQLLITTHNTSLMEEVDFIRRDALWFSEKGTDGSVSLYSAADFDSTTLRKDASIIKAYKAGRLGAKPNLGSPYLIEKPHGKDTKD